MTLFVENVTAPIADNINNLVNGFGFSGQQDTILKISMTMTILLKNQQD